MKKSFKHFKRHLPSVSSFEKDFFISCSERNIDACMYCNCKIVNMHTYIFNAHKAQYSCTLLLGKNSFFTSQVHRKLMNLTLRGH